MRELNMESLQEIVRNDSKSRYNLVLEADPASGDEAWWIRANQGHSMKVSSFASSSALEVEAFPQSVVLDLQSINSHVDIPTGIAVHGTNKRAWEIISMCWMP